ncbi:MAG: VWA domain-containing protein [Candidatus Kapaibacteriota bacterium]
MMKSMIQQHSQLMRYTMKPIQQFLLWACILCSSLQVYAFDSTTIVLQANDPRIIKTAPTENGQSYTITVTGTYSMWPEFTAYGVDAMYVYHVPSRQLTTGYWPMEMYKNANPNDPWKLNVYSLALPVHYPSIIPTDSQLIEISSKYNAPGYSLKAKIHPFNHIGFRFNNAPLNNYLSIQRNFRLGDHTYSFTWVGDGKEISLQILDSLISRTEKGVMGGYADNTGSLTVKIEKTKNIVFCDVQATVNGNTFQLQLDASIFTDSLKNITEDQFRKGKVGLFDNDNFLCPIDIQCDKTDSIQDSLAIGLLVDRSGSMTLPIDSLKDTTIRMNAIKIAVNKFLDGMKKQDSAFAMSFATQVTLDQDWTNNIALLKNAVNGLQADGWTSLYEAIIKGVTKVRLAKNPVKAIVLLSDGSDQHHPDSTHRKIYYDSVLRVLKSSPIKVPIYCISLGLSKNPEDVAGVDTLKLIARESGGEFYLINSARELNEVYTNLRTSDILKKKCCKIIYEIPPCKDPFDTVRVVTLVFPVNGKDVIRTFTYKLTCSATSVFDEMDDSLPYTGEAFNVSEIAPNPSSGFASIAYELPFYGNVSIAVFNQDGTPVRTFLDGYQDTGRYRLNIDLMTEPPGMYTIVIKHGTETISRKMLIVR